MKQLLLLAAVLNFSSAEFENAIIGEPIVECADNYFQVFFETRSTFKGVAFVQKHLESPECRTYPSSTAATNSSLKIPFHACGVVNTISTSPRGIFLSASVVVAFNPNFLTKNDRVFKIQCFYMEMERRIQKEIQITTPPGTMLSKQIPMPVCKYEVFDGSPTGPPVYFATVGQMVYHKWSCETEHEGVFCMLVHSCFVNDGNGQSVQLLNEKGCALDKYLLTNLEYPSDLMAGREAHVYKYADRDNMYFDCQISITVKEPGLDYCDVPQCPDPPRRRRSDNGTTPVETEIEEYVYPTEDIIKIGWFQRNFLMAKNEMCMTTIATAFFVFTNFALIFLATFILIRTLFLRSTRKH